MPSINFYVLSMLVSVAFAHIMMIYAVIKHTVDKSFYLILLSVSNLFFIFGNYLEIIAPNMQAAFFGVRVQYNRETIYPSPDLSIL